MRRGSAQDVLHSPWKGGGNDAKARHTWPDMQRRKINAQLERSRILEHVSLSESECLMESEENSPAKRCCQELTSLTSLTYLTHLFSVLILRLCDRSTR